MIRYGRLHDSFIPTHSGLKYRQTSCRDYTGSDEARREGAATPSLLSRSQTMIEVGEARADEKNKWNSPNLSKSAEHSDVGLKGEENRREIDLHNGQTLVFSRSKSLHRRLVNITSSFSC